MPKFLITADLHLHAHKKSSERLNDCLNVLDWIFQTAKDEHADSIIFCGDLFHDRQSISIPVYQKTFEIFRRHLEGADTKIYLLLGNHDLWHLAKWDVSSVFPLDAIENVRVVDSPCTMMVNHFPVSFLPYTTDPIKALANCRSLSSRRSPIKPHDIAASRVLCGHIAINGAVLNVMHQTRSEASVEHDGDMIKIDAAALGDWDHIFLGHYHAAQNLDWNAEYVGSPLQLSFGEAFQHKHVVIFDTDTGEKKYVRNTFSPQHFIIPQADLPKYELKRNFVKIIVDHISATDLIEMRKDLVENHHIGSFEVVQDLRPQEQKQIIEDAKAILQDRSKMVEEYIAQLRKANSLDGLTDERLIEIWQQISTTTEE